MTKNPVVSAFPRHRTGILATAWLIAAAALPPLLSAQGGTSSAAPNVVATGATFYACYVPQVGAIYLIKLPGLPAACLASTHEPISWSEGTDVAVADGAITTPKLALAAVTTDRIADGAITTVKLAAAAVGTSQIANGAVTAAKLNVPASGDLGGSYPNPTVIRLQGRPVANSAPTSGQVLLYNAAAAQWQPSTPPSGVTAHGALSGLSADDHPQYLMANGARSVTGNLTVTGTATLQGATSLAGRMQVNSDGGAVVTGTYGAGTIPASGPGSRLMWHPARAAFRAGIVSGTQWDDANIGNGSIAMGVDPKATGLAAVAIGNSPNAGGTNSIAIGGSATASGPQSVAIGSGVSATGNLSFAAGYFSTSSHNGAFVYGDAVSYPFPSTAANEFAVRATGGVRFVSAVSVGGVPTAGVQLAAGGGSWSAVSDRAAKTEFAPVDTRALLGRVAALPIATWRYRSQAPTIRHIGPTAQDFAAAFGVGEDDRHITSIDADGVALAAIQGLHRLLRDEIATLTRRIESLQSRLAALTPAR